MSQKPSKKLATFDNAVSDIQGPKQSKYARFQPYGLVYLLSFFFYNDETSKSRDLGTNFSQKA